MARTYYRSLKKLGVYRTGMRKRAWKWAVRREIRRDTEWKTAEDWLPPVSIAKSFCLVHWSYPCMGFGNWAVRLKDGNKGRYGWTDIDPGLEDKFHQLYWR